MQTSSNAYNVASTPNAHQMTNINLPKQDLLRGFAMPPAKLVIAMARVLLNSDDVLDGPTTGEMADNQSDFGW